MFLKSLNIQGFKSFPDKTTLDFNRGITAVVGPNGSGKSNISDAVSWVLGEQSAKSLRGGKMEDVIFNGTQKRSAMGFSKVSIVIDNSDKILEMDADEVTIARKYYRSGESEYSVNGNSVRLRDVQELLMDTGLGRDGYAVISQGKISEIVSAKSKERRQIFEEAAGISKFRYRKIRTERQLLSAEENLVRLKDILAEIEGRLEPLKNQAHRAKKFVQWSLEERELQVSLFSYYQNILKKEVSSYENNLFISKIDFDKVESEIKALEDETKEVYDQINLCSIEVERLRKEKENFEKSMADNMALIAVHNNDIFHNEESIKRLEEEDTTSKSDVFKIDQIIFAKTKEEEKYLEEILVFQGEMEKENNSSIDVENNILKIKQNREKLEEDLVKLTEDLSRLNIEEMTMESRIGNINQKKDEQNSSEEILLGNIKSLKKEIEEDRDFKNILDKKIEVEDTEKKKMESSFTKEKLEFEKSEKTLQEIRNQVTNNENRTTLLKDLESSMEDFTFSVRSIMEYKKQKNIRGIRGPVSTLISVPEDYVLATETALSFGIQNIVVENEEMAKECIKHLQSSRAGRATFLPLTSVKGNKLSANYKDKGFVGVASDLVEFSKEYEGVINQLLGRVVIVDNIDNGANMAKNHRYSFRIVTLDGQVINAGGSFTGGSKGRTSGILSRKNEITSLEKEKRSLLKKEDEKAKTNTELALKIAKANSLLLLKSEEISLMLDDKMKNDYHLTGLLGSLKEKEENLRQIKNAQINLKKEIEEVAFKGKNDGALRTQIEKNKNTKEISLVKIKEENQFLREKKEEHKEKTLEIQIKILGLEKELALVQQSLKEQINKKEDRGKMSDTLLTEVKNYENEIEEIKIKIKNTKEEEENLKLSTINSQKIIQEILEKRKNLEISSSDSRKKEKQLTSTREEISKEKIRLEERKQNKEIEYDKVVSALWEEYQLTVSSAQDEAKMIEDVSDSEISLKKIKGKIRSLGTVDVSAIEEYKDVLKRYNFLSTQIEDVIDSKKELKGLIDTLTTTMEEMFHTNFIRISKEFSSIFSDLFGGGVASLSLEDPNNLLESGIEIDVQPPGKVIKNITSLSGGEKSFVAIAIYFAILRVRPAPFCLLDEIEAALDDVNVIKFASYLRTFTNNTQFIAISHRRGTMEEADALYGVTMQEEGVSKLLKLQLEQVEESLGMKAV